MIALSTFDELTFVNYHHIVRCKADNMYTIFYFIDKSAIGIRRSIKECEDFLKEFGFIRVHRSHIVNIMYIKKCLRNGDIILADNSCIRISVGKRERFNNLIRKWLCCMNNVQSFDEISKFYRFFT